MHVYVAINLCDSMWLFRTGIKSVQVFYYFFISILSMEIHFISILSLEIHLSEWEDWNHITSLTPPYFCASSKPGHGFSPMPNDSLFYVQLFEVKRWLFVLLILVELLTITVLNFFFPLIDMEVILELKKTKNMPYNCFNCWIVW